MSLVLVLMNVKKKVCSFQFMSVWNAVRSSWPVIQRHKNTIAFHVEKIRQEFDSNYRSPEALAALANGMKESFQNQPGIPQEFIQQVTNVEGLKQLFANGITNQFLSYVLTLRSKIQDEVLSICLSENGFNETLWLKYADMHKGFCLMYDPYDKNSFHCGKLKKYMCSSFPRLTCSYFLACASSFTCAACQTSSEIIGSCKPSASR